MADQQHGGHHRWGPAKRRKEQKGLFRNSSSMTDRSQLIKNRDHSGGKINNNQVSRTVYIKRHVLQPFSAICAETVARRNPGTAARTEMRRASGGDAHHGGRINLGRGVAFDPAALFTGQLKNCAAVHAGSEIPLAKPKKRNKKQNELLIGACDGRFGSGDSAARQIPAPASAELAGAAHNGKEKKHTQNPDSSHRFFILHDRDGAVNKARALFDK